MSKLPSDGWLIRKVGTARAEQVKGEIKAGGKGPFNLSGDEACWLSCQMLSVPSETLASMLGIPARTIRLWRADHMETQRARRNDEIWQRYQAGTAVREIAAQIGLSTRWVYEIIRWRKRGKRMAYRRLF